MKIKYFLEDGAFAPEKAHKSDAGFDIKTPKFFIVDAHASVLIDTGIHVAIPEGYVGMLKSKSGLNVKHGIVSEGVIDAGYEGSICVKLYNHSDFPKAFEEGNKITQIVFIPIPDVEMEAGMEFVGTERGANGFGSTGI